MLKKKTGAIHVKNWLDLCHWDIFHGLIASFDCFGSGFINSLMGWSFLSDLKSTMLRSFEEQWTRSRIGACHWLLLAHSCDNWCLATLTSPTPMKVASCSLGGDEFFHYFVVPLPMFRLWWQPISRLKYKRMGSPLRKDQLVSWHGPFSID